MTNVSSSPDSDDTLPGDESEEYRDDTFLVNSNNENNYYGKTLFHLSYAHALSNFSTKSFNRHLLFIAKRTKMFCWYLIT